MPPVAQAPVAVVAMPAAQLVLTTATARMPPLFDCCQDTTLCCQGFWCMPCVHGSTWALHEMLAGMPHTLATPTGQAALTNPDDYCLPGCGGPCFTIAAPNIGANIGSAILSTLTITGTIGQVPNPLGLIAGLLTAWIGGAKRKQIRARYNIPADDNCCGADFCTWAWCATCATCQEAKFVRAQLAAAVAASGGGAVAPMGAVPMQPVVVGATPSYQPPAQPTMGYVTAKEGVTPAY